MAGRKKNPNECCLKPLSRVLFVRSDRVEWLSAGDVRVKDVGQKAFGLSAIPAAWTLPFFSVSAQLLVDFLEKGSTALDVWIPRINEGLDAVGITGDQKLLVRSSGCNEGMGVRGNLHTVQGTAASIREALQSCLAKLSAESSIHTDRIPLLIQKTCVPVRARGHLSNERRCYEERRDWMGEIESADADASAAFKINLRHWRERVLPRLLTPLNCNLSSWISEVLKGPAEWAYGCGARVHFEWVWSGAILYLVQADEEIQAEGFDPEEQYRRRKYQPIKFTPRALRLVTAADADAKRFAKIRNIFVYYRLNLPTAPLYILDDQEMLLQLSRGQVSAEIAADLAELVQGSLVIRTDLATGSLSARQLLPRTQEVRSKDEAIGWLTKQSQQLCQMNAPAAFLFHNFIPARSSAFAYASPGEPVVQIEGLWGLPEGLYYNSHDKFVVDTRTSNIQPLHKIQKQFAKFGVRTKTNFKRYYVSPDDGGKWQTFSLKPSFDWRASLAEAECKYIAYHSRRIAEEEGMPVSLMWFVGVPEKMAAEPMIPWYHERFDPRMGQASITSRTKTTFDRCFVVRAASDVETLKLETQGRMPLRRIRVQPQEETLLRDKNTLKNIGEAAKKHDAVIVLEGAVLSHAYYQLLQTGAVVEVVHPFVGFEERVVFNKLVRDKVPDIIRARKERPATGSLNPETHIKALREKLIEEAYELLDARDLDSVVAEMADVETVVRTLRKLYRVTARKLEAEIRAKRKERGGFDKGIVLLETESILPTTKMSASGQLQFAGLEEDALDVRVIGEDELLRRTSVIDKRVDKHVAAGSVEITAAADISVTRRTWEVETKKETTPGSPRHIVSGAVRAERAGLQWKVEVAVRVQETPPDLL